MKNYFIPLIALVLLVLFFQTPAVFAEEAMMETVEIGTVAPVSSEDFIQKISTMSYALYNVAVKVMAPLTVIILIIGGMAAIFFKAARTIIVWAIIGLTLVFWSPMIVQLVMNWVTM